MTSELCNYSLDDDQGLPVVRPLQAVMIVADAKESLTITGNGDVVEPHDGVIGGCCIPLSQLHGGSELSFYFDASAGGLLQLGKISKASSYGLVQSVHL